METDLQVLHIREVVPHVVDTGNEMVNEGNGGGVGFEEDVAHACSGWEAEFVEETGNLLCHQQ